MITNISKIKFGLLFFAIALGIFVFANKADALSFIDIGFRVNQGTQAVPDIQKIAIEDPTGAVSSPLMLAKNGTKYHVALVDPSDPLATKVRIKLASGVIKALRKIGITLTFDDLTVQAIGARSGANTSFVAHFNVVNSSPYTVVFTRTSYVRINQEAIPPASFTLNPNSSLVVDMGDKTFPGYPAVPPTSYSGDGTATYSVTVDGVEVDTVTYTYSYAF